MKLIQAILCALLLSLSAFSNNQKSDGDCEKASQELIQLSDSVSIIQALVRKGDLSSILEEHKPEELELIVQNFSPVELAFESEVGSCTVPVVVCFFDKQNYPEKELQMIADLIKLFQKEVKVVAVDSTRFFTLADCSGVYTHPTFLFFSDGREEGRLGGSELTSKAVKKRLSHLLEPKRQERVE